MPYQRLPSMISLKDLQTIKQIFRITIIKYGVMAVIVVSIEVFLFWVINSYCGWHYLAATNISLIVGILLNWIGSRYYVFGSSKHNVLKEFVLVAVTSLVGVFLQSATMFVFVDLFKIKAIMGKLIAIIITFFWNYLARKHYIYRIKAR